MEQVIAGGEPAATGSLLRRAGCNLIIKGKARAVTMRLEGKAAVSRASGGGQSMRAAVVEEAGAVPAVRTRPVPAPGPGEVLVEVAAAGLNPHDLVVAAGIRQAPPVPYVPGVEGVGRLADGTRVYFSPAPLPNGSMAEYTAVPAGATIPVPDKLTDADAIGLGTAGTTAWLSLTWKGGLKPGESVLVMGATGAVGQVAVQAAKLLGARRVTAAGRDRKTLDTLLGGGADEIVVLDDGYEQRLLASTAGAGGFDLVIDSLFAAPLEAALRATRYGGRLVNLGMRAGRTMELSGLAVKGRDLLSYSGDLPSPAVRREAYERMAAHVLTGALVIESETVPLEDVGAAWQRQAASPNKKLVIVL
jgi:NADPH2:quinone reductase